MSLLGRAKAAWKLSKRYQEQSLDAFDKWVEMGVGGYQTQGGRTVGASGALALPAAYACIALKARVSSIIPCKVYRRTPSDERVQERGHYLHDLLSKKANPILPSSEWRSVVSRDLDGWGNHISWIEWDRRPIPTALWPIPPDAVKIERKSATSPIQYSIKTVAGTWEPFPAEDILHLRGFGDGTRGFSPVELHRETLGLGLEQIDSASAMLRDGSTSRLALEFEGTATPEQIKILRESFQEANAGGNKHKAIVLQAGMKAKAISINPKDAQFLELSGYNDQKVYQIYGTYPHMVGDTDKATSWGSGIEQLTLAYINYRVLPEMAVIEDLIEGKLLPDVTDYFVEHDFKALLRGDTAARSAWYQARIEDGSYSPNDILRHENETPYKGGDVYRRPLNTAFVDKDGNQVTYSGSNGGQDGTQGTQPGNN